jgi:hypothetical protein
MENICEKIQGPLSKVIRDNQRITGLILDYGGQKETDIGKIKKLMDRHEKNIEEMQYEVSPMYLFDPNKEITDDDWVKLVQAEEKHRIKLPAIERDRIIRSVENIANIKSINPEKFKLLGISKNIDMALFEQQTKNFFSFVGPDDVFDFLRYLYNYLKLFPELKDYCRKKVAEENIKISILSRFEAEPLRSRIYYMFNVLRQINPEILEKELIKKFSPKDYNERKENLLESIQSIFRNKDLTDFEWMLFIEKAMPLKGIDKKYTNDLKFSPKLKRNAKNAFKIKLKRSIEASDDGEALNDFFNFAAGIKNIGTKER